MKLSQLFSIGLCGLVVASCGAKKDKATEYKSSVTEDKIITADYQKLLKGTLESPFGSISFEEDNSVTVKSWVAVRNRKISLGTDYYTDCQIERKGTYEVLRSGIDQDIRFVIYPTSIKTLDAKFQRRGTRFDITPENKKNILGLCDEYTEKELKTSIDSKLVSISKNHIHFYYRGDFSIYNSEKQEWTWDLGTMVDDFTNFYSKKEDQNINILLGMLIEGTYSTTSDYDKESKTIKLARTSEGTISYEYNGEKCASVGEFDINLNRNRGPELKFEEKDPCLTDTENFSIKISDIGYSKDEKEYIYLKLPFGLFTKIIEKKNSMRK